MVVIRHIPGRSARIVSGVRPAEPRLHRLAHERVCGYRLFAHDLDCVFEDLAR
jgi:hypothetical protein